jgi:hypothetical protein
MENIQEHEINIPQLLDYAQHKVRTAPSGWDVSIPLTGDRIQRDNQFQGIDQNYFEYRCSLLEQLPPVTKLSPMWERIRLSRIPQEDNSRVAAEYYRLGCAEMGKSLRSIPTVSIFPSLGTMRMTGPTSGGAKLYVPNISLTFQCALSIRQLA